MLKEINENKLLFSEKKTYNLKKKYKSIFIYFFKVIRYFSLKQ